jgi:hypothetical protein
MTTHETVVVLTENAWEMVGRLILTMVTSSELMKTAIPTVARRRRYGFRSSAAVISIGDSIAEGLETRVFVRCENP